MPKYKPLQKWDRFWLLVALWICECREIWEHWNKARFEKCKCTCGKWREPWVMRTYLNTWHTISCWCARWLPKIKHWDAWNKLYCVYYSMKRRCDNPNSSKYKWYWAKWIKCLWNDYDSFKRDMWESYYSHIKQFWANNTQIDRIDNNWNYCKENCRWVTAKENSRNRSSNHIVELWWEKMSLIEAYEKWNPSVSYKVFLNRIYLHWLDDNIDLALHWSNEDIKKYLISKR